METLTNRSDPFSTEISRLRAVAARFLLSNHVSEFVSAYDRFQIFVKSQCSFP